MVYDLETMAMTKRQLKMFRCSLGVSRMAKIRCESIRGERLRGFGHLPRRERGYLGERKMKMELQAGGKAENLR